ncbi:Tn3 family transposase [Streptomyces neyagawaensis]|uniref:Tn3 family transposase n=1 Tax=Streptomyces neyagawaensis TaxID=42238 RepID=UPI000A5224B8
MTAATSNVESFNRFSQWIGFGNRGVIADNDPIEQEQAMRFNPRARNPARGVRPEAGRRLRPAA